MNTMFFCQVQKVLHCDRPTLHELWHVAAGLWEQITLVCIVVRWVHLEDN